MSELRKCKTKINGKDIECLFHCFSIRNEVIVPSASIGGVEEG